MSLIVNGKAYDWGDVDIALSGLSGLQPTEISYDDELEKELVYGAGYKARGYGRGNYKTNAKITVSRDDYDIILDYCKRVGKKFYEIEVPKIVVSYANDGGKTRIDVLNKAQFTKRSMKASQGDKELSVDIDLLVVGTITQDGVEPI